jgi:4-hydroxy-2-oxoheptanedioate aldolase
LASAYSTEICAGAGFDWLLLDGEHAPNDLQSILMQLQIVAAYPDTHPIVRVPVGHGHAGTTLIKQYLDVGAATILVPMVDTAEQAKALVEAMRYPPHGIRGMGGARASRWGRYPQYAQEANQQVCLLVQAETTTALKNLDAIAAVEGVDGVFIGPADLSASMGHVGNQTHPEVKAAIEDAFRRILKAGKAPGILTPDEDLSRHYLSHGGLFMAVGLDNNLLARHTSALCQRFKNPGAPSAAPAKGGTY